MAGGKIFVSLPPKGREVRLHLSNEQARCILFAQTLAPAICKVQVSVNV